MPRIVYGVLDVHRSHRIERPSPIAQRAAGRPDACTNCHTMASAAWAEATLRQWSSAQKLAEGPGVGETRIGDLLQGDPVTKAVAADALGRTPVLSADDRKRTVGALLNAMAFDRYPAVRHIAWRSLRRVVASDADAAAFDPSADAATRLADVRRIWSGLRGSAVAADPAVVFQAPSAAPGGDVEIGE
jgi:hypothetical protein